LSTNIIKQKALRIYKHLKKDELSSKEQPNISFLASKGWFENFKKRFSLRNVKFQGEQASADVEAAQKFILEIPQIIEEGEYSADQIFNADETALYWKKLPSRTFISKVEKQAPGYKLCKDRVTLHMCSKLSGNFVVKPMIINRTLNPRAMKNLDKSHLPVLWRANKKGWMTQNLFEVWFKNCFIPEVEQFLKKKNLSFKVLLLIDNAGSHSRELNHPNVKIVFFPPKCTSLIQPLDQGIIATLKAYYIRLAFQKIFERLENDKNVTLTQAWKEFSILDCVAIIALACKELKQSTLHACWKPLLPKMVQKGNIVPFEKAEYNRIISVASNLEGDGFSDMNIDDVRELFEEQTLNEEELIELLNITSSNYADDSENICNITSVPHLNSTDLQEGIALAKKLEDFLDEKDLSVVRSGKFKRELQSSLAPYREILTELQDRNRQVIATTSDNFCNDGEITSEEEFQPVLRKKSRLAVIFDENDDEN
jgi:DDE superfamily endonuclease/Tc5 transposase DNA-binding domain